MSSSLTDESGTLTQSLAELSISLTSQGDDDDNLPECMEESMSESIKSPVSTLSTPMVIEPSQKRIAFMIDFSLTAFLMMGNLSAVSKHLIDS